MSLDQIMLKNGEADFELWLPSPANVLRVTSATGAIPVEVEHAEQHTIIRRQP